MIKKETVARTANVRHLQLRPDISHTHKTALANLRSQIQVDTLLIGRRNDASDKFEGTRRLSTYNPVLNRGGSD